MPTRDITLPDTEYINWKDISPRVGVVYDLFGNGKTAVKANMSDYVIPQRTSNDYSTMGNPVNALAQLVPRSWNDSTFPVGDPRRQNFWPDCDLLQPAGQRRVRSADRRQLRQADRPAPRATPT